MNDKFYIKRCLQLAEKGRGYVSPNPMVGCVIVHDDKIIGEGFHQKYGEAHAEVNAINSVKDKTLLERSTIYVSLEPCAHFGKTPPCSDLIVYHKIPNAVIGCIDSFGEVSGKGVKKLKDAGVDVKVGILEKECLELNKRFFTFHNKKRPYIILKWAQTKDGFIDKKRTQNEQGINWITQPETQLVTHKWRSEEDAILVGANTIITDNPSLTTRAVVGKNPVRVILGKQNDFEKTANINTSDSKTIFIDSQSAQEICEKLYQLEIQSVIIEGGKKTLELFIESGFWDEARIITGNIDFKEGLLAPTISAKLESNFSLGKDLVKIFVNA